MPCVVLLNARSEQDDTKDLESFFSGIKLDENVSDQALNTLKSEGVTLQLLVWNITDEDLEEIGIDSDARNAILARAQVVARRSFRDLQRALTV